MDPVDFPESNLVLKKPKDMTDKECASLPICACSDTEGKICLISCWEPSAEERSLIAKGYPIWLFVIGDTHPPVALTMEDPFNGPEHK